MHADIISWYKTTRIEIRQARCKVSALLWRMLAGFYQVEKYSLCLSILYTDQQCIVQLSFVMDWF